MNLTQVMNVTLPEPPAAKLRDTYPRVHPKLVTRDHYEREGHMVHCIVPDGPSHFFRFSIQQFELIKLFNGRRTYKQIAELFTEQQRININEEFVKKFADNMEKRDFWYRTPQEESITLFNKLAGDRHKTLQKKSGKSASADLSIIELIHFDPDRYLTWIHGKLKFMYENWWNAFALVMVGVMCVILGARWDEVWLDSVKFYNFTEKGLLDFVEFFFIFALLGAVHETAHGMTCKHYGGESHKMGAFLMYLMPGVFCDVTQIFVHGGRWQRIWTLFAGVWSEIQICSWVSVLWWFTPQGTWLHDFCYKLILSGGIFVVIINLNPLARMDGYYIFCELTRHFDLKGNSTALLSNMVRKYIFRMNATVPVLPLRRKLFFAAYAAMAGLYSYALLLFFVKLSYRIMYRYQPEWAFVPATMFAIMIFKSRIKKLMAFLKTLYLDKREMLRANWKPISVGAAAVLVLGCIPFWRDSVEERFVLEPQQRAVVRTTVPGMVTTVHFHEGQPVNAGDRVVEMRDLDLQAELARANAEYARASARNVNAQLRYADFNPEERDQQRLLVAKTVLNERAQQLNLTSPISGMVTTPRMNDLVGTYVAEGTPVAEIVDTRTMQAKIFIPEDAFEEMSQIDNALLRMDAKWKPVHAATFAWSPVSRQLEKGLMPPAKYKGMRPPVYYVLDMTVENPNGELKTGMTGTAKINGQRRSTWWMLFRPVVNAVARRIW